MKRLMKLLLLPNTRLARWLIVLILLSTILLSSVGYFNEIKLLLDSKAFTFKIGYYSFTLYDILNKITDVAIFWWLGRIILTAGEQKIRSLKSIQGNTRTLVIKVFQCSLCLIMLLITLDVLGIDLTALTVFGGAISIGVGFGLSKITSNFLCGLILLFEKTIKEGDMLELSDGVIGIVKTTNARYTLIETYDNRDIMIPNEDFITQRITNWTYNNTKKRLQLNVSVSSEADLELVYELLLEAALEHPTTSKKEAPSCYLKEFANNLATFTLYFWVDDITLGSFRPTSDVLFLIWKKFKANKIAIPAAAKLKAAEEKTVSKEGKPL